MDRRYATDIEKYLSKMAVASAVICDGINEWGRFAGVCTVTDVFPPRYDISSREPVLGVEGRGMAMR